MSMFRFLLKTNNVPPTPIPTKLYLIENGVINTPITGDFEISSAAGTVGLETTQYNDKLGITTGIWRANWFVSSKAIPFSDYSKMCIEFSRAKSDAYGKFAIFKEKTYGAEYVLYELIETTDAVPRAVVKYKLPNPIPASLDKLYCLFSNVQSEIYIYNLWLEQHILPDEYQQVEYIQSSGTQRINTGIAPNDDNYGFKTKFKMTDTPSDWSLMNIGGATVDKHRFGIGGYRSNNWQISYIRGMVDNLHCYANVDNPKPQTNIDYEVEYNYNGNRIFKLNGVDVLTNIPKGENPITYTNTWNIFCQAWGTTNYTRFFMGKLYYMKIYLGTTLVRDFVPCYRKSDNVAGMYDLVNDVFYTNAGSGSFTVDYIRTVDYNSSKSASDNFAAHNGNKQFTALSELDVTSSVTGFIGLFYGMSTLQSVSFVDNIDTSNITSMADMFSGCQGLQSIDLSNWNTSNVFATNGMFDGCYSLTSINLAGWDTSNLIYYDAMFRNCTNLRYLDIRSFTFSSNASIWSAFDGVSNSCEIIVKSQTEKDWFASKFTRLTNVKTVAEYEAEQNS